jgi:hypothetical protein
MCSWDIRGEISVAHKLFRRILADAGFWKNPLNLLYVFCKCARQNDHCISFVAKPFAYKKEVFWHRLVTPSEFWILRIDVAARIYNAMRPCTSFSHNAHLPSQPDGDCGDHRKQHSQAVAGLKPTGDLGPVHAAHCSRWTANNRQYPKSGL